MKVEADKLLKLAKTWRNASERIRKNKAVGNTQDDDSFIIGTTFQLDVCATELRNLINEQKEPK